MAAYLEHGLLRRTRSRPSTRTASASWSSHGRRAGPRGQARTSRSASAASTAATRVDRVLPPGRPRLRELLAVPGADRPAGRGPGRARRSVRLLAGSAALSKGDPWHGARHHGLGPVAVVRSGRERPSADRTASAEGNPCSPPSPSRRRERPSTREQLRRTWTTSRGTGSPWSGSSPRWSSSTCCWSTAPRTSSIKEAAIESAVWISIGLAFTGVIYLLAARRRCRRPASTSPAS